MDEHRAHGVTRASNHHTVSAEVPVPEAEYFQPNYTTAFLTSRLICIMNRVYPPGRRHEEPIFICDLGVGIAAIPIALCRARPDLPLRVVGIDCNHTALDIGHAAVLSAGLSGAIELVEGDMCDFLTRSRAYHFIYGNLPQMPTGDPGSASSRESIGHDGGADGLQCIRAVCALVPRSLIAGGICAFLLFEFLNDCGQVAAICASNGLTMHPTDDGAFETVRMRPDSRAYQRRSHILQQHPGWDVRQFDPSRSFGECERAHILDSRDASMLAHRMMVVSASLA